MPENQERAEGDFTQHWQGRRCGGSRTARTHVKGYLMAFPRVIHSSSKRVYRMSGGVNKQPSVHHPWHVEGGGNEVERHDE